MKKPILFFAFLQIVQCLCPDGFEIAGGECRGFYGTMDIRDDQATSTAISKCKELQAQPVIIHNKEQQSYWTAKAFGGRLLLGLVCDSTSKKYEWADGSTVDYKPPKGYYYGLDEPCSSSNAWGVREETGIWTYYTEQTTVNTFDIFCTAQLHPNLDEISDDACTFFEDDTDDGVCYQVGHVAESWQEAQLSCLKLGANLASIHTMQENSFVRRLAVSKGAVTGLYLGATLSGKGASYGWIDGSTWDYDNFAPGFPVPSFGDCIAMDTSTSDGQWMNTECSAKFPVACIRQQKVIPEPTCRTDPWKEGEIVTSPGFPYSASTSCDYYLRVEEEKRVEVEILLLEANYCCDSLILYDGYIGGVVLANLTGAIYNATYTTSSVNIMRVSWLPKGGVNVLGMALTFRGV